MNEIGPANLQTVIERNKADSADTCASHDFCDANVSMHDAFVAVTGREPLETDSDIALWGKAWDRAAKQSFANVLHDAKALGQI